MPVVVILQIIQAILSSVPEAIKLWDRIAPLLDVKGDIPEEHLQEIVAMAPAAIEQADRSRKAVRALVETH